MSITGKILKQAQIYKNIRYNLSLCIRTGMHNSKFFKNPCGHCNMDYVANKQDAADYKDNEELVQTLIKLIAQDLK